MSNSKLWGIICWISKINEKKYEEKFILFFIKIECSLQNLICLFKR